MTPLDAALAELTEKWPGLDARIAKAADNLRTARTPLAYLKAEVEVRRATAERQRLKDAARDAWGAANGVCPPTVNKMLRLRDAVRPSRFDPWSVMPLELNRVGVSLLDHAEPWVRPGGKVVCLTAHPHKPGLDGSPEVALLRSRGFTVSVEAGRSWVHPERAHFVTIWMPGEVAP